MNREMYVYKSVAESRVTNAHHIIHSALTGSRSPAGPRRLGTATRISASLSRRLFAFFGSTLDQAPKAAKYAVLIPGPGMFVNVRNVPRVVIAPNPKCALFRRVSRCVRSFAESRVVYPLSLVKANVGHLCEKLKNAMKNGLGQHCDGNFLEIYAGTISSEKLNFLSRIFGR